MSNPEPEATPQPEGLTEDELKSIFGEVIDERLKNLPQGTTFDSEAFRSSILGDIGKLLDERSSGQKGFEPNDEFFNRIGSIVDAKLAGRTPAPSGGKEIRRGFIGRWLAPNS